jgi:hypothetical protein
MMDRNKVTPFNTGPRMVTTTMKPGGMSRSNGSSHVMDIVNDTTDFIDGHLTDADTDNIKVHMLVIAACGKKVGVVDAVEGQAIKLTKLDSKDNSHHYVPLAWVQGVDSVVQLSVNSDDAERGWKKDEMAHAE